MKISTLLSKAAEQFLCDGTLDGDDGLTEYSCLAVYDASRIPLVGTCDADVATTFLEFLGVGFFSSDAFKEFPRGPVRQSVRYCWLKFAAHVAREEGL